MPKKIYSFRLKPETHKLIKLAATAEGKPMTKWLEEAVELKLHQREHQLGKGKQHAGNRNNNNP